MKFALLGPLVAAQACRPDLLIDDYSVVEQRNYDGALRYFNRVNADYGHVGMTATYEQANRRVVLVPTATDNFWFVKFNIQACFDLRGYTGIQFDITAPTNSSSLFTLTQQAPDCITRLVDSVYTPLDRYITPNGVRQTVLQPLSDFALNLNNEPFDWVHFKDWTAVNLLPVGARFEVTNFILKGNCSTVARASSVAPGTTPSTAVPPSQQPPAVVPPASPTLPITAGADATGILASIAAVVLSLFA
jgi:hypothetical protein